MKIGRYVANGDAFGAESIIYFVLRKLVTDESKGNGGEFRPIGGIAKRSEEAIDVHRRKLLTEEVAAVADGRGDLQRRGLRDVRVPGHISSPMRLEQSTRPSEGSAARLRRFR